MMEKLLNEKEAAKYLGIPEDKLKRLVREKKLPAYKIGGQFLRFTQEGLDEIKVFDLQNALPKNDGAYPFLSRLRDYFYYNDFYIIAAVLIIILLALVFKASF